MKAKNEKMIKSMTMILVICIIMSNLISIPILAAGSIELLEAIDITTDEKELMPAAMNMRSDALNRYLNKYASQYGYTINEIKYDHDVPLSNGYYYHAGQYGGDLMCFIYDSEGNVVEYGCI